jgi:response regulator RpfG family c-di-GMP phosphodiesterase
MMHMLEQGDYELVPTGPWRPSAPALDAEPAGLVNIVVAGTLLDVAKLVTTLLRVTYPDLGARTDRITELVRFVSRRLELAQSWEFEVAARLSQIGYLGLDPELVSAWKRGDVLNEEHQRALASHPLIARDLLAEVARLENVREMIARQSEPFTVPGCPTDSVASRDRVDLGAHLLHASASFDDLVWAGEESENAAGRLRNARSEFCPEIIGVLATWAVVPGAARAA